MVTYSIVDVFTRERFCGNPVAVIHDGSDLSTDQMQRIANEFGFSETTFVLPRSDPQSLAQVRIFTPSSEVPFAGHPNIGTAFVVANEQTAASGSLGDGAIFDEAAGPVPIWPIREAGLVVGAEIQAPQPLQVLGKLDTELVAKCIGLAVTDIDCDRVAPCVASVGLPFAFVEVQTVDALAVIAPDIPAFRKAADIGPPTVDEFAVCAFVMQNEDGPTMTIRSRVFSPLGHPAEDPATGSASGALGALLSTTTGGVVRTFKITQGVEMGRPGQIEVQMPDPNACPRIRGYCVSVAQGDLRA